MSNGRRGGQPGNNNACKTKIWQEAIKRALARCSDGRTVDSGLDKVATQLVQAAFEGDPWAIDHIADRLDGKPVQAIAGEEGAPVRFIGVVELVKPGTSPLSVP